MINLFSCQKQTDNQKWVILSTYIKDMCTNITEEKKCENRIYWKTSSFFCIIGTMRISFAEEFDLFPLHILIGATALVTMVRIMGYN